MSEKRFFTKVNNKGRLVIIDKECHIELIDLTLACEVLNRLDLKLKHYNEVNGEQQATITHLTEEIGARENDIKLLRAELQDCKEIKENWESMVAKATEVSLRNVELNEENAQLRQRIRRLRKELEDEQKE